MIKFKSLEIVNYFEKLFSDLAGKRENVINLMSSSLIEFLKVLTLNNTCNGDLKHWIDQISGFLVDILRDNLNPVLIFLPLYESGSYPKGFSRELISKRFGSTRPDIINNLLNLIEKQTVGGVNKYRDALKIEKLNGNFYEDLEIYFLQLKYIALCLSGQLNPETDNWYDPNVYKLKIDWNKSFMPVSKITKENLRPKILKCFENIIGSSIGLK